MRGEKAKEEWREKKKAKSKTKRPKGEVLPVPIQGEEKKAKR